MITPMHKITVVGRRSLAEKLMQSLQGLGVVHINPTKYAFGEDTPEAVQALQLDEQQQALAERWQTVHNRAQGLQQTLEIDDVDAVCLPAKDIDSVSAQLEQIASVVDAQVATRQQLEAERDIIRTYLRPFREIAPSLARFDRSRYLTGVAFTVADLAALDTFKERIAEELPERVVVAAKPYGDSYIATAAMLQSDRQAFTRLLRSEGLAEMQLPEQYRDGDLAKAVHQMEARSNALPLELAEVETELANLAEAHGGSLVAIEAEAHDHNSRYDALQEVMAGQYGIALQGWLPSDQHETTAEQIRQEFAEDVVVETRPADEHSDRGIPTQYNNPGWVKPFQGLMSLFPPPKYGNFEPTWTIAFFFPLFFGVVVGDIGFGLLFAILAWWLRRRGTQGKKVSLGPLGIVMKPDVLLPISTIIAWCAFWSILWGALYGEGFGNLLERWPANNPVFYARHHAPEADASHAAVAVLDAELAHDAADIHATTDAHTDADATHAYDSHATDSHGSDAHASDNHAPDSHASESTHAVADHSANHGTDHGEGHHPKGMFPILIHRVADFGPVILLSVLFGILQVLGGWGIRAYYGLKHGDKKHMWEGIGMFTGLFGLAILGFSYFYGFNAGWTTVAVLGLAIWIFSIFMSGLPLMSIELMSNAGNILSYLRLFAVGLSAALIANLCTDLGFAVGGTLPVIGPILGILLGFSVNVIAVAVTIIGHTLQPLRLQYVEFFTKFGFYEESGQSYNPLRLSGGKA